jgi:hypothetical protein
MLMMKRECTVKIIVDKGTTVNLIVPNLVDFQKITVEKEKNSPFQAQPTFSS